MTEVTEKKETSAAEQPLQQSEANTSGEKAKSSGAEVNATPKPGQPRQEKPPTPAATETGAKKGGASIVIAIIALLITAGATVAGYSGWQQLKQQQTALEVRLAAEEQALTGLQSSSQSERDSAHSLQQRLATLEEGIDGMKQHDTRLDETLAEINKRLEERRGNEWLVAEARHLINIANQQAQLNHNPKAALAALEAADQRLRDADEPALLKARQALTDDIAALRTVATVDIPGIALLLSQLEQQVAGLPLASQEEEQIAAPTETSATAEVSGLERFFLKVWSDIKGLVVIRHASGPQGSAVATPDQRLYLQQNLRLKLEIARLALLQRDTQTFRDTLATVRQWLEGYYDTKASATAAMLTSLAPFATLELQPELPDISNALRALDNWQEQHKNRTKVEAPLKAPLKRELTAS